MVAVVVAGKCLRAAPLPLRVSDVVTGHVRQYVVRGGDSLTALGARFGVSAGSFAAANNLRSDKGLVAGQQLTIDNRHVMPVAADAQAAILINVPQRMLFRRRGDGTETDGFPIAVGRPDWQTPIGPFRITLKEDARRGTCPSQHSRRRCAAAVGASYARIATGPRNPLRRLLDRTELHVARHPRHSLSLQHLSIRDARLRAAAP